MEESLKKLLAVKLYEKGIIGFGKARELANVSRLEFLNLLHEENVPFNFDCEELEKDLKQVKGSFKNSFFGTKGSF